MITIHIPTLDFYYNKREQLVKQKEYKLRLNAISTKQKMIVL